MALTGYVSKWLNRKGYGFINVLNPESEHFGNDIFVHLSGINLQCDDGYKCLYPGEYVSFDLEMGNEDRPICVNVTGVMGGRLLIEHSDVRFKYTLKRPHRENEQVEDTEVQEDNEE